MPYKVQFIGLAWFHWEPAGNVRVLMPDGRNFKNVPSHKFSISVAPEAIVSHTGWLPAQVESDASQTQFWVPPSKIVVEGTDQQGVIDANKQVSRLPSLRAIDPNAKIDYGKAKKVGDFEIQQGVFEAFRMPGQPVAKCGLVSALDVAHDQHLSLLC